MLKKAQDIGVTEVFEVSPNGEVITHLHFADDTMLFGSSRRQKVINLMTIMRCLQLVSGLKVNLSDSMVLGVGCTEENPRSLATCFCCKSGKFPIHYLGLPIGANPRSEFLSDPVVEKFEKNISMENTMFVFRGRITLIKIYYMSLFKIPR